MLKCLIVFQNRDNEQKQTKGKYDTFYMKKENGKNVVKVFSSIRGFTQSLKRMK